MSVTLALRRSARVNRNGAAVTAPVARSLQRQFNVLLRDKAASAIVLHAQAVDVDTVWVAGKLAKRHGMMLADTRRACGLLQEANERIRERVEAAGGLHISPEEAQKRMLAVSATQHGEYDFS